MDHPFLEGMTERLVRGGLRVVRFEFPYMERRRSEGTRGAPDRQPVLSQRWHDVAARLGEPERLVIGGKSMGGRIASLVADELGVGGLVCLGYPFHPPGKPEKLRTAHLEELRTPTLVLQGERDTFGRPEEVEGYRLAPTIRVQWIPDGDHSFAPRKRSGHTLDGNLDLAAERIAGFVAGLA